MSTRPASPDPVGRNMTTVYDGSGRPVRAGDPPGVVTTTTYDLGDLGRRNVTWARIDAQGNVIERGTGPAPGPELPGDDTPPDEPHVVG